MVGTFYASSSPEAKPFVTVGQSVKKGADVVGYFRGNEDDESGFKQNLMERLLKYSLIMLNQSNLINHYL